MNLNFMVNDYILIWNLLFQASISENVHSLKQKIWVNYKKEYNETFKDNPLILKDPKNFIPNDDTVYNIVLENKNYEKIKKETEKLRVDLLKIWDDNKKKSIKELKDILKIELKPYDILIVTDKLDIIDTTTVKKAKVNTIVWGKKLASNPLVTIIKLVYEIVRKELKDYKEENKDIVNAIIELAIINEFATRLTGVSHYLTGDNSLKFIKKQIYPYWLMYLGVGEKEVSKYMKRDNILYDTYKYPYEKRLKNFSLKEFIDFCIRNRRYIIVNKELELI